VPQPGGIDVHAHFFPESFLRLIELEGAPAGGRIDRTPRGPAIVVDGVAGPPLDPTYWDLDRRVRAMNRQGVQVHALSLTMPMTYWAGPELGARLARAFNDALVEAHRAYPDRFVGCATLALQDPPAALAELRRVAALPGMRAVYAGTNVADRDLSDPALFPVLEACQALRLPLLLHPLNVIGGGGHRLAPFYLRNTLGNPFDTAVAAAHLIFGGVLDRLPRLEVGLPHGGGALPYLAGRLERGQKVRPEARAGARRKVTAYLRRFVYDTITHSPGTLRFLVETVGADRVMLGSDFCFDMGYQRPRRIIEGLGLRAADRTRILRGNAAKLLRVT
jgi:aminocarboxymuconate-semialdehyde decarboxylase